MFAVIFEAEPHPSQRQRYLSLAAELKPLLSQIDGFIAIERFQSLTQPEKILSLSWWRDHIFSHYRLRVAAVMRDYGNSDRAQAPQPTGATHNGV